MAPDRPTPITDAREASELRRIVAAPTPPAILTQSRGCRTLAPCRTVLWHRPVGSHPSAIPSSAETSSPRRSPTPFGCLDHSPPCCGAVGCTVTTTLPVDLPLRSQSTAAGSSEKSNSRPTAGGRDPSPPRESMSANSAVSSSSRCGGVASTRMTTGCSNDSHIWAVGGKRNARRWSEEH